MALLADNRRMLGKLLVVALLMFGFGYALVPMYRAICDALGINVLSLAEQKRGDAAAGRGAQAHANTQVDTSRTVTVEFDANARGPWDFKPAVASVQVHPGQLATVMYEFRNKQDRTMAAQAIPSYAPKQAMAHFNKLECFCFNEYTLRPGESKQWPVAFIIDPKLPKDVTTITLSYTFFEVGGKTPPAPSATLAPREPRS
jgi:cytochrome c oxidase assembly protein subunit 11